MSPCVVLYVDGSALEAKWSRPTRFDVEPGMHDLLITHTAGFWRMKPLELSLEVSGPTEVFYRAPFVLFQRGKVVVRPSLEPSA